MLLGELAHEVIHRRAQILGQLLDLLVAGAALQRLLQRVLRGAQRLVDIGDVAVLDGDCERPQARHHLAQRVVGAGGLELPGDAVEAEILAGLRREQFRRDHQRVERGKDLGFWLASSARMRRCSISARASGLVNSRSGSRMLNGSLRPSLPASSLAVSVSVTSAPA